MGIRKLVALPLIVLTTVLVWSGLASAHVTIEPESAAKGAGDQTLTFRVPNEETSASTVQLKVQFPSDHPIAAIDPLAMPGWTIKVETAKLAKPITTDDGTVTEAVSVVTWSGGKVPPGQYGEFKVLAQGLPSDTDSLTFKAIQTYDDGKEVAWIETGSDAEHPAPTLKLTAAASSDSGGPTATPGTSAPTASTAGTGSTTPAKASGSSSDSSKGLAIAGIALGAVALVLALRATMVARKKA